MQQHGVSDEDRFRGCLLGLALGDAMGAPHEGGPVERLAWRVLGRSASGKRRWTDDTQMTLDVAESLIEVGCVDPDDLAHRFARSYRWSRGYGPSAARILKRISRGGDWRAANRSVHPSGSYGNGGAMRVAPIGLLYRDDPLGASRAAGLSAEVTHAHPLGIEGAALLAHAVACLASGFEPSGVLAAAQELCKESHFATRLELAEKWIRSGTTPEFDLVRTELGIGMSAVDSCVTAIWVAFRFLEEEFVDLLSFVRALRGDVDTIGAMAGALWGAHRGASVLPTDLLDELEDAERISDVALRLYGRSISPGNIPELP